MMATKNTTRMISPGQIKYLHVLYRSLGLEKEDYQLILENDYDVSSTKDLTFQQAFVLIGLLSGAKKKADADKITYKQIGLIRHKWIEVDYSNGEQGDVHMNKFIKKRFGKETVEELNKKQASMMIRQIKAMKKQADERAGKTTVLSKRTECVYCQQPIMWVQLKRGERVPFDCTEQGGEYVATDFHNCKSK